MNEYRTKFPIALQVCCIALLTLFVAAAAPMSAMAAGQQPARAAGPVLTPPPLPQDVQVLPGFTLFLETHGVGTQNYICRPSGASVAFALFTPQATLFTDHGKQLITHFSSPSTGEPNTDPKVVGNEMIRVTWQDSQDTSTVWAKLNKPPFTDSAFVAKGAVAWLLLEVVNSQKGPTGGDTLTSTKFIQRVFTSGGVAPAVGCTSPADLGNEAFVPYSADYLFYKAATE